MMCWKNSNIDSDSEEEREAKRQKFNERVDELDEDLMKIRKEQQEKRNQNS